MNYWCGKCYTYFKPPFYCIHYYHPEAPTIFGIDWGRKMRYTINDQEQQELDKRFTYHKPKDDQAERYGELRDSAKKHAELLMELVPPSRERSVALTQLEDSTMWANAGIARNE